MSNVEVLLREHVPPLGRCGEVVRVRPGYARNYLFPFGLAVEATPDNKKQMERRRVRLDAEEAQRAVEIDARIAAMTGIVVQASERADEQGHLYGSVNAAAIVALLAKQGHGVEEKAVRLDAPIKAVGEHVVKVHVHGERFVEVKVVVAAAG